VADCVTAAVKKVLEKDIVAAQKLASWVTHGEVSVVPTYLTTHTSMFAAAYAGRAHYRSGQH
jgi:hypothetical protein